MVLCFGRGCIYHAWSFKIIEFESLGHLRSTHLTDEGLSVKWSLVLNEAAFFFILEPGIHLNIFSQQIPFKCSWAELFLFDQLRKWSVTPLQ